MVNWEGALQISLLGGALVFAYIASSFTASSADTASEDSVNMTVFYATTPSTDSCTYTSGTWNVNWYDNCTINSNINLQGNSLVIRNCGGSFTLLGANITNYGTFNRTYIPNNLMCQLNNYGGSIRNG